MRVPKIQSVLKIGVLGLTASMMLVGAGCGSAQPLQLTTSQVAAQIPQWPDVSTIEHLLTIQSDASGRRPTYFSLDLLEDAEGNLVFINFYRNRSRRASQPRATMGSRPSTSQERQAICEKNSVDGRENCDASIDQLVSGGIVIERCFGRPGATLAADADFSASRGGSLVLRFVHQTELESSARDVMGELRLKLERSAEGWVLLAAGERGEQVAINAIKLNSSFRGAYASGVASVEVGFVLNGNWQ